MRKILLVASLLAFGMSLSGCGDPEVIVTRERFGKDWPLTMNSAKVVCAEDGAAPLLKVGVNSFALNEEGRALGYPEPTQYASGSGDISILGGVCAAQVAANR